MPKKPYWNFSSADNFVKILSLIHSENRIVKKKLVCLFVLSSACGAAHARTAYVTDNVEIPLRSGETERSRIVKVLGNGTILNVLEDRPESGYSYVQANNGAEGFILSRYLSGEPSSRSQLEAANKKLEALTEENKQLKAAQSANQEIGKERDKISSELSELQQTAANAIQLKQQRDQLQEQVVSIERELQQLKRENQALTDSTNQDWFLYGGGLSLFGVLLGFILPRMSWRRRTSGWGDSF